MQTRFIKSLAIAVLAAVAVALSPTTFAQIVSSAMTGTVRTIDGKPVSGASVTVVHTPTNSTTTVVTNDAGRFSLRGLPVGGPFTVSAASDGYKTDTINDVATQLANDINLDLTLKLEVLQLEKFVTTGTRTNLDSNATGAGTVLGSTRLEGKPTAQRSLADLISASPLVTLRATVGDREESQLSAVGQNNRYNSILIDGARINDQFGLNMTGLASFFNPLSIDTLEQLSVQVSPYDVRQAGFTGATINAVTKSGTNKLKGSAYYIWGGDELYGLQMQGEDIGTRLSTGAKNVPKMDRTTYGLTLGGPLWKDRLFFFVNYEKFERISAPGAPGLLAINDSDMNAFINRLAQYNTASGQNIPWGENISGTAVTNSTSDEKKLAKLDWNINDQHRASIRYSTTEGSLPQYGKFQSTSVFHTLPSGVSSADGLSTNGATALSTHIYTQLRNEEVLAAQVFSRWTPDFRTEAKYSQTSQNQDTPLAVVAPEVTVFGLNGTLRNGTPTTTAAYVAGTEFSRQGNQAYNDSKNFSLTGEYNWGRFLFSGGLEREEQNMFNLFRNGSFGTVHFANLADFLADRPTRIDRVVYDPNIRPSIADISEFATNGLFAQAKLEVNRRLTLQGGFRYEWAESSTPPLNAKFLTDTGFNNTGTPDGVATLSPRLSFNLALNDDRSLQLRGGIGHFLGRAPWVIFSNSYNNLGIGTFTDIQDNRNAATPKATLAPGSFTTYLQSFDTENPIGTGTDVGATREVNWTDSKIKLPSVWRGNLALDLQLPAISSVFTLEAVHTRNDQQFFITNENLRPSGLPSADGRTRFSGTPTGVASNSRFVGYNALYRISNVSSLGQSTYLSMVLDRPMKDHWSASFAYTHGKATDGQSFGQTTASGQFQRNVVFNQNTPEEGTSDFEVKHRIQLSYSREFEFVKQWTSTVSLYYEGRSGENFSWVYASDLNGDGGTNSGTFNDLVAVPVRGDSRFDFSHMTTAQVDAYFAFLDSSGLGKYAGGIAPKNAFNTPWINRLDLKFSQKIPLYKPAELELFLDFINFGAFVNEDLFGGYFVEANRKHFGSEMFRRNLIGPAVYTSTGLIKPQATSATATTASALLPDTDLIDNGQSRWRIQIGARLKF